MTCRELRRLKEEEGGGYQCGTLLSQRYLLQRLLGKGGFSEVYQVPALAKTLLGFVCTSLNLM